jgi:actin-related protein 5
MRMKNIANLASDNPTKKRRRGGDEDTFGADDADWAIYRQIATGEQSEDEEEEDPETRLKKVEEELLQYDPNFTEEHTFEAQSDWTNSIIHSFVHGPWPFDPESARDKNQVHLNIERLRIPEVVFQPVIAGVDQAGVGEIACDIFTQRLTDPLLRSKIMNDVFLTGGNTLFQGFEERLQEELRSVLKNTMPMHVRKAKNPTMDAWRGAAQWASRSSSKPAFVSREEYLEYGSEYFKVRSTLVSFPQTIDRLIDMNQEHNLGNALA